MEEWTFCIVILKICAERRRGERERERKRERERIKRNMWSIGSLRNTEVQQKGKRGCG